MDHDVDSILDRIRADLTRARAPEQGSPPPEAEPSAGVVGTALLELVAPVARRVLGWYAGKLARHRPHELDGLRASLGDPGPTDSRVGE